MKHSIDGVTYNTQSAIKIATATDDEMTLYQNCAGVFFVVGEIDTPYRDQGGKWQTRTRQKWKVVGDATKARAWCERYGLVIVRDVIDDLEVPSEAVAGEKLSTISWLRPPSRQPSVRRRTVR
jgi:hypothetical protein